MNGLVFFINLVMGAIMNAIFLMKHLLKHVMSLNTFELTCS
jgi:hypothetical protein